MDLNFENVNEIVCVTEALGELTYYVLMNLLNLLLLLINIIMNKKIVPNLF